MMIKLKIHYIQRICNSSYSSSSILDDKLMIIKRVILKSNIFLSSSNYMNKCAYILDLNKYHD